jgi:hypothetical protein
MPSLSDRVILDTYIRDCSAAWEAFKDSGVSKMRKKLITAVNTALASSGVPTIGTSEDLTSTDNGTFEFGDWKIVFGGASATTGQSSKIFADTVNTVYHESRHCEQWFRIAQALAAGSIRLPAILPSGITRPAAGNAASIEAFMFIPRRIANLAVANTNLGGVQLRLVQGWFESIYGVGRNPRGSRLNDIGNRYQDYRSLAEELDAWHLGDTAGEAVKERYSIAYPNLYDWKLYTKRSFHFRSGKFLGGSDSLTAVDAAILAYEQDRTTTKRAALKRIFDDWERQNPKEAAKRDVVPAGETVGCITQLRNWLNQPLGQAMGGFRMV